MLIERYPEYSRTKIQALIKGGSVVVDGLVVHKPGMLVETESSIGLNDQLMQYVSRGGVKLEAALSGFALNVTGMCALDIGISTGGFTDCLLQHGVTSVIGVDVGTAQVDPKIKHDPRVTVYEKTDIRDFTVPYLMDLIVADVSFISVTKLVERMVSFLKPGGYVLILVKPQFEVGKEIASRSAGVIKDSKLCLSAVYGVVATCVQAGFVHKGTLPSAIKGGDGNQEYFVYLVKK